MTDAPTGKGALVFKAPGKIEDIDATISRSILLGGSTLDENGEAFFAPNDRKRIVPEGGGAASDDKPEIVGVSKKGFTLHDEPKRKRFLVKLDGPEYASGLAAAIRECASESFCRLCQQTFNRIVVHFMSAHSDEGEPDHVSRFGDMVGKYVRRITRAHAKLEKAGRKVALELMADDRAKAEIQAIRDGYVKLNGEWIPKGTA